MTIARIFAEHREVLEASAQVLPPRIEQAARTLLEALRAGGKVLICGNGGSAADAQHFAAELVGRYEADRSGLAVIALTTDTSAITAIANDYGFPRVFARQIEALARPGDVLIALSTSGNSENVVAAAVSARSRGCIVIAFTGQGGGALAEVCDQLLAVPSERVARVQEMHELCLHALAQAVEEGTR